MKASRPKTAPRRAAELLLAGFALALVVGMGSASAAPAGTIVAGSGKVRAELTYAKKDAAGRGVGLHMRILREGKALVDSRVPVKSAYDVLVLGSKDLFQVRDLDADGEPEVLLDLYTGGAHCCSYSLLWRYLPGRGSYGRVTHSWGNVGFRLVDLDRDGRPEFRSADDRFAYAFTAYAASFFPVQIWQYGGGLFTDVTRQYPRVVAADLSSLQREYRRLRAQRGVDLRGLWAAYAADSYLLGRGPGGWRQVRAALRRGELKGVPGDSWPSGKRYLTALKRYLVRLGYAHA